MVWQCRSASERMAPSPVPSPSPPGPNNLEIKSPARDSSRRVSFYDTNANRQRVGLRVVLSWDTDMTDLDLHVVSPDGQHVFYGHRVANNGGALDVHVTGGYGPKDLRHRRSAQG